MTESTEKSVAEADRQSVTEAVPAVAVPPSPSTRPNRLYQTAAWVAIVAGLVFIVGAIFFTGFALGRHSGPGGWDGPRYPAGVMIPRPPMGDPDGRGPGMMGPGMMGPGMMGPDGPAMRGGSPTTALPVPPGR